MRQFLGQVLDALARRQTMTVSLVVTTQGRPRPLVRTMTAGETLTVVPQGGGEVTITVVSING